MKQTIVLIVIISLSTTALFAQKSFLSPAFKVPSEREQKLQLQKLQVVSMVEKTAEEAVFWEDKKQRSKQWRKRRICFGTKAQSNRQNG
jgi:hypothetical protein